MDPEHSPPLKSQQQLGIRWAIVVLVLAAYAVYMVHKFGVQEGLLVTYLTWSFFVLATPVADAGGILDIPIRLLTGTPMVMVEAIVITITTLLLVGVLWLNPNVFDRTTLLRAFHIMLMTPNPYWLIILFCIIGTLLSVRLGDIFINNMDTLVHTRSIRDVSWTTEFWVGSGVYAAIWWVYLASLLPLLRKVMKNKKKIS